MSSGRHRAVPPPAADDEPAAEVDGRPRAVPGGRGGGRGQPPHRRAGGAATPRGPTSRWWTPIRIVLALTVLVTVFGYLQKTPVPDPLVLERLPVHPGLLHRHLRAVYGGGSERADATRRATSPASVSVPYRDHPVEYPPIIGGLMWTAAELTAFVHRGTARRRRRPQHDVLQPDGARPGDLCAGLDLDGGQARRPTTGVGRGDGRGLAGAVDACVHQLGPGGGRVDRSGAVGVESRLPGLGGRVARASGSRPSSIRSSCCWRC